MPARLQPITLHGPGVFGLNTDQAGPSIDPRWALTLRNAIFDSAGRIAAREGWTLLTTGSPHSNNTEAIFEYVQDETTKHIISAAGNALYSGTTTLTTRTGGSAISANNWQFVNFNGSVVGVQASHVSRFWDGVAGTFADTSATNRPTTGNSAVSAWGRLFVTDTNERTIHFTPLLMNLTSGDWTAAGGGSWDTSEYWPDGRDHVVAMVEWQDRLLVFGERSVLIYTGMQDPANDLALEDVITSGGTMWRDSVVSVGTDLLYLARDGLRSIQRGIQFSTLPYRALSRPIRQALLTELLPAANADVKASYSAEDGAYFARIANTYWYWDVRSPIDTGDLRASRWDGIGYKSIWTATDGTVYLGQNGGVAQYTGYQDNVTPYVWEFKSTWLELGREPTTIIPKYSFWTFVTTTEYTVDVSYAFDFSETFQNTVAVLGDSTLSEWGSASAEWAISEWGAGQTSQRVKFQMGGFGDRLQLGVRVVINGAPIAVQRVDVYSKAGRLAA